MNQLTAAFAAVLLALLPLFARAETPPQDAVENIVMVKINGKVVDESAVLIQSKDGDIWLDRDTWTAYGLEMSTKEAGLFSARGLGVDPKFDAASQSFDLLVPGELLPGQQLGGKGRFTGKTAPQPKGVMINYDLAGSIEQSGDVSLSAAHEARMGVATGTLVSTGQLNSINGKISYVRGLTVWQKDFHKQGVVLQAGDVFSPRSNLANPVNLGGVRIASDRGLRQGEQFTPVPLLGGIAQTASRAQLQVNGSSAMDLAIKPGPWQFDTYGTRNGTNELALVVKDEFGREQVITEEFYVAPGNLPKGKTEFDIAAGVIRPDLGKDKYTEPAASVKVEHGLNDKWTIGASVQATQDSRNVALSNRFILGRFGAVGVDVSQSTSPEGKGSAMGIAYDYNTVGWSVRASHTRYSENHWMLSNATQSSMIDDRSIAQITSIGGGYAPKNSTWNIGANAVAIDYHNGESTKKIELVGRMRRGSNDFGVGLSHDSESKDMGAFISWRKSFGPGLSVNSNIRSDEALSFGTQFAGKGLVRDHEVRWSAGANHSVDSGTTNAFATAGTQLSKGDLSANLYYDKENSRADARFQGSIWVGEGGITTQRTTSSSFVVVEVPGQAGVPVSSGGGFESKTNKRGFALVPDVQPLVKERIQVNTTDLPLEVGIESATQDVVVSRLGGAKVVFELTTVAMRELSISRAGKPVVSPAKLITENEEVPIGQDGGAVLMEPVAGGALSVKLSDGSTCKANLPTDLGTFEVVIKIDCKGE